MPWVNHVPIMACANYLPVLHSRGFIGTAGISHHGTLPNDSPVLRIGRRRDSLSLIPSSVGVYDLEPLGILPMRLTYMDRCELTKSCQHILPSISGVFLPTLSRDDFSQGYTRLLRRESIFLARDQMFMSRMMAVSARII